MVEKNTSRLLIKVNEHTVQGLMAQWYEASLLALEEVGVRVQIKAGLLPVFIYFLIFFVLLFLSSYFYPLACFCLFSLMTLARFLR